MKWPLITRSSHDEMVGLLQKQVDKLEATQVVLLDRLAAMGLGGPLFNIQQQPEPEEEPEELVDPNEEVNRILSMSHRPSQMAREITKRAFAEARRRAKGPDVAWIPQQKRVLDELDAAEGRQ